MSTIENAVPDPQTRTQALPRTEERPRRAAVFALLLVTFMSSLDVFIVNVAVPSIQRQISASDAAILWATAGFGLLVGVTVITAGRLGDIFGQRRMLIVGVIAFTLASALCGGAQTGEQFVAARMVQAVSVALMSTQVLAVIATRFEGKARASAFTGYGLTMGVAAVFGQLLGGMLMAIDLFDLGWRLCFLVNLPVGILTVALVCREIRPGRGTRKARLDIVGTALLTAGLVLLVAPLMTGTTLAGTIGCLVASAALLVSFALYERRLARRGGFPLVPLGLFADRGFVRGGIVQVLVWAGQGAFFLVLALYLQQGLRLTPLGAGAAFVGIGVSYIAASMFSGRITRRLGRQTVALGAAAIAAGLVADLIAVGSGSGSVLALEPGLVLGGIGMGLVIGPLSGLVLSGVQPAHAGAASGVFSMIVQLAGAFGTAAIGGVYYAGMTAAGSAAQAIQPGLYLLIGLAAAIAVAVQFMPKRPRPTR